MDMQVNDVKKALVYTTVFMSTSILILSIIYTTYLILMGFIDYVIPLTVFCCMFVITALIFDICYLIVSRDNKTNNSKINNKTEYNTFIYTAPPPYTQIN